MQEAQLKAEDLFVIIGRITWEKEVLVGQIQELQFKLRECKCDNHATSQNQQPELGGESST